MSKISVYTILYWDLQFYEDIIQRLYPFVDEFILVDGPYAYAVDTLKTFQRFYDQSNPPIELQLILQKYPKVKYVYGIFNTEEDKRMMGYNLCRNDIVLLVDTDEFLDIDVFWLQNFISNSDKYVAETNIVNMCDYNVYFNQPVKKAIAFKKSKITSLEHLDYLWLVGCKQNAINPNYFFPNTIGSMYHFTLNRNKANSIIKFLFYVLLHRKNNQLNLNILDSYTNLEAISLLSIDEILTLFVHCDKNRINIPAKNDILHLLPVDSHLQKYADNKREFEFSSAMRCLLNLPICLRFNEVGDAQGLEFTFENVDSVSMILHSLYLGSDSKSTRYEFTSLSKNNIHIEYEVDRTRKYMYVEIICTKTQNGAKVFTLTKASIQRSGQL